MFEQEGSLTIALAEALERVRRHRSVDGRYIPDSL
jgi:hypothetical protein